MHGAYTPFIIILINAFATLRCLGYLCIMPMPNHRHRNGGGSRKLLREKTFMNFGVCIGVRSNFRGANVICSDLRCVYSSGVKYWGRPGPPHYTAEIPSQLVLFVVTFLGSSLKLSEISIFVRKSILNSHMNNQVDIHQLTLWFHIVLKYIVPHTVGHSHFVLSRHSKIRTFVG